MTATTFDESRATLYCGADGIYLDDGAFAVRWGARTSRDQGAELCRDDPAHEGYGFACDHRSAWSFPSRLT